MSEITLFAVFIPYHLGRTWSLTGFASGAGVLRCPGIGSGRFQTRPTKRSFP